MWIAPLRGQLNSLGKSFFCFGQIFVLGVNLAYRIESKR